MSILRQYNNGTVATENSANKNAVTFTTTSSYNIDSVVLPLFREGSPGTLTVSIYATSSGLPSGSPLTSGTYNGNSLSDSYSSPTIATISVTPYLLAASTQYAIVTTTNTGHPNYINWLMSSTSDYPDGVSYYYVSNWTVYSTYDYIFETYGGDILTDGEYLGAGSGTTKLLLHLNGSSTDSSGNGNNGTDTNVTYSLANGKFGQGASFNGSSSSIVKKDTASLKITTNITISAWINPSSAPTSSCVAGKFLDSTHKSYWLAFNGGKAGMYISTNGSNQTGEALSQTLSNGVWYNVIGTYDGTNTKIYVNGSLANSIGQTGGIYDSTGSFAVGKLGSLSSNYFPGKIDEVIVENRAWTASEIKKYYTNSLGRF